jgi:hypothetical protein
MELISLVSLSHFHRVHTFEDEILIFFLSHNSIFVNLAGCKENPSEWGDAPIVEDKNWVPDVTMIRKMMLYGKDRDGNPFPPPLATELCEDISVTGEKHNDENKRSLKQTMIRPTGQLNSTTVTINPQNHYGQDLVEADGAVGSITVPAPKVMCLVYTMANAHANRIRAMRETWAGGCDGFLAFSTESDPRLPAISLEHEGPEEYGNVSFDSAFCQCIPV